MRRALVVTLGVVSAIGLVGTSFAHATIGTKQASATRRGGDPSGQSMNPSISADGRYVAFESRARNLVPGDGSGLWDIFVRDVLAGTTVRASMDAGGEDPDGDSFNASISADGRYVAFDSEASDLVAGDGNGESDIFVRDLVADTTVWVSVDLRGGDPNEESEDPSISADGRHVAFESAASDLVADPCGAGVFVRDLLAGETVRVDVDTEGGCGGFEGDSFAPSINADGRWVAFGSYAEDLVDGCSNGEPDIFVRDLDAGHTFIASVSSEGHCTNDTSYRPSISADGRYVAFDSYAPGLVEDDDNNSDDIFVHDVLTGTTIMASVDEAGGNANSQSLSPSISADGRFVAYHSYASDFVPDDMNGARDVYIRDLIADMNIRVSVDEAGGDPDGDSTFPAISADGTFVAFHSLATDLVAGSGDSQYDIFVARLTS